MYEKRFHEALIAYALIGRPFTSEDITKEVGLPNKEKGANQNNLVGALMNGYSRSGVITKTGLKVKSRNPASHSSEINQWVGKSNKPKRAMHPVTESETRLIRSIAKEREMYRDLTTRIAKIHKRRGNTCVTCLSQYPCQTIQTLTN